MFDPTSGFEQASIEVGEAPQSVLVNSKNEQIYVKNFTGRSVTVIDGSAILGRGANFGNILKTVKTVASENLSTKALLGKQIFYNAEDPRMSEDGYISCASCHDGGGHDGRVWDFTDRGEGLRNTIDLRGRRSMGHGRLHWSANFDELQDFEGDIRNEFGGDGFMRNSDYSAGTTGQPLGDSKAGKSAELDALAAYIETLVEYPRSPFRSANGNMTTAAVQGKALFTAMNCAQCHSGNDFTDSTSLQLHNIGTIKATSGGRLSATLNGIDSPTLKGLWDSAPYLHDGSATSLRNLISTSTAGHGGMNSLTGSDIDHLVAYHSQLDGLNFVTGSPPTPGNTDPQPLTRRIEAETGVVAGSVGVRTDIAGFNGSGYIGDFSGTNTDRVTVTFTNLKTSTYDITVRYFAYSPQQNDLIINGVTRSESWPATGGEWRLKKLEKIPLSGDVSIAVKKNYGYMYVDYFQLHTLLTANKVTSVAFSSPSFSVGLGQTVQMEVATTPIEVSNSKVYWSVSDTSVATVNSDGVVKAVGKGVTQIMVTTEDGGLNAIATIAVGGAGDDGVNPDSWVKNFKVAMSPIGGGVEVRFDAVPGERYKVQFSEDLVIWNDITEEVDGGASLTSMKMDQPRSATGSGFYRIVRVTAAN